jgi:hypothetical protein
MVSGVSDRTIVNIREPLQLKDAVSHASKVGLTGKNHRIEKQEAKIDRAVEGSSKQVDREACDALQAQANGAATLGIANQRVLKDRLANACGVKTAKTMSLLEMTHIINENEAPAHPDKPADHGASKNDNVATGGEPPLLRKAEMKQFFGGRGDSTPDGKAANAADEPFTVPNMGAEAVFMSIGPIPEAKHIRPVRENPHLAKSLGDLSAATVFVSNAPHKLTNGEMTKLRMSQPSLHSGVTVVGTASVDGRLEQLIRGHALLPQGNGRVVLRFTPEGVNADFVLTPGPKTISSPEIASKMGTIDIAGAKLVAKLPSVGLPSAFVSGTMRMQGGLIKQKVEFEHAQMNLKVGGGFSVVALTEDVATLEVEAADDAIDYLKGKTELKKGVPAVSTAGRKEEETEATKAADAARDAALKIEKRGPKSVFLVLNKENKGTPTRAMLKLAITEKGLPSLFDKELSNLGEDAQGNHLYHVFARLANIPGVHEKYDNDAKPAFAKTDILFEAAVLHGTAMKLNYGGAEETATTEGALVSVNVPATKGVETLGVPINIGRKRVPVHFNIPWPALDSQAPNSAVSASLSMAVKDLGEAAPPHQLGEEVTLDKFAVRVVMPSAKSFNLVTHVDADIWYQPTSEAAEKTGDFHRPAAQALRLQGIVDNDDTSRIVMTASTPGNAKGVWNSALGQKMDLKDTKVTLHLDSQKTAECPGYCGVTSIGVTGMARVEIGGKMAVENQMTGTINIEHPSKNSFLVGQGSTVFKLINPYFPMPYQHIRVAFPIKRQEVVKADMDMYKKFEPPAAAVKKIAEALAPFGPELQGLEPFAIHDITAGKAIAFDRKNISAFASRNPFHLMGHTTCFGEKHKVEMDLSLEDLTAGHHEKLMSKDNVIRMMHIGFERAFPTLLNRDFGQYADMYGFELKPSIKGRLPHEKTLALHMKPTKKGFAEAKKAMATSIREAAKHVTLRAKKGDDTPEQGDDEITSATGGVAAAVHTAVTDMYKRAKEAQADVDNEVRKLAAYDEKEAGMNVPDVPPENEFEKFEFALKEKAEGHKLNLDASGEAKLKASEDKSIQSVSEEAARAVKAIGAQLRHVSVAAKKPLEEVVLAMEAKHPTLEEIKISELALGCLYDPHTCDSSKIKPMKISFCYTELGCSTPREFFGMAGVLELIHDHAKAKAVEWLSSVLFKKDMTIKLPNFASKGLFGGEVAYREVHLTYPVGVNRKVFQAFENSATEKVPVSALGHDEGAFDQLKKLEKGSLRHIGGADKYNAEERMNIEVNNEKKKGETPKGITAEDLFQVDKVNQNELDFMEVKVTDALMAASRIDVVKAIVELKAYCVLARPAIMETDEPDVDESEMTTNQKMKAAAARNKKRKGSQNAPSAFIEAFGIDDPKTDVVTGFAQTMSDMEMDFPDGIGSYFLTNINDAILAGKSVLEDGHFNIKTLGLSDYQGDRDDNGKLDDKWLMKKDLVVKTTALEDKEKTFDTKKADAVGVWAKSRLQMAYEDFYDRLKAQADASGKKVSKERIKFKARQAAKAYLQSDAGKMASPRNVVEAILARQMGIKLKVTTAPDDDSESDQNPKVRIVGEKGFITHKLGSVPRNGKTIIRPFISPSQKEGIGAIKYVKIYADKEGEKPWLVQKIQIQNAKEKKWTTMIPDGEMTGEYWLDASPKKLSKVDKKFQDHKHAKSWLLLPPFDDGLPEEIHAKDISADSAASDKLHGSSMEDKGASKEAAIKAAMKGSESEKKSSGNSGANEKEEKSDPMIQGLDGAENGGSSTASSSTVKPTEKSEKPAVNSEAVAKERSAKVEAAKKKRAAHHEHIAKMKAKLAGEEDEENAKEERKAKIAEAKQKVQEKALKAEKAKKESASKAEKAEKESAHKKESAKKEKKKKKEAEKTSKENYEKTHEKEIKEIKVKWEKPFWDVDEGLAACTPTNGDKIGEQADNKKGVTQCRQYDDEHCKIAMGTAKRVDSKQNCPWEGSRVIKGCNFLCQRQGPPAKGWKSPADDKVKQK